MRATVMYAAGDVRVQDVPDAAMADRESIKVMVTA
jgi:hypothetical protein